MPLYSFTNFSITGQLDANTASIVDFVNCNRLLLSSSGGNNVRMIDSADGVLTLTNDADNAFTRINLGPATSSFPALKRSSAALEVRLADDSASANLTTANLLTSTTIGTPGSNCTAEEHGDAHHHVTKLTLTSFAVGTGGDAVDKAIGAVCYTFPAGAIFVDGGSVEGIFDQPSHGIITDGEVGLGTVVGAGAVDTIAEVGATSGDVMLGRAIATYTLGTTRVTAGGNPVTAGGVTVIATGASPRTVFLNLAATWPNIASAEAVTFTGTVTIRWRIIA